MIGVLRNVWKNRRLIGDRRWCKDRRVYDAPVEIEKRSGHERRQAVQGRKSDDQTSIEH